MAEFSELVQALTWLVTNRIQQKIDYTHGLLGDGNGRVRVSKTQGDPEVDFVFARPDRFSNRTFKVFNKRIEGQDGDPIIIGELPWEPGLVQVVDMDWAAYANVGWGDDVTTTIQHGNSHQWRDGAPGIDTFNIYRRQFGDLKTYSTTSGTLSVGVSPYSLDLYGKQYQWAGTQNFSLSGALPTTTGTARMAMIYWSLSSGTTQGYLGVATGTLGGDAEATILNRPPTPEGAIPSAFVRLAGGQSSITEFDIWDAREPFRPGILFGTGTGGLSADMIPISDTGGIYTGSTIEAALDQIGFDGARVSKVYQSDFGATAIEADAVGNLTVQGTGTFSIPLNLSHAGDPDTRWTFAPDDIEASVGGTSMLKLTNAAQDLITLGPGSGDVDIDFNGDMFLQGSNGFLGIGTVTPAFDLEVINPSDHARIQATTSSNTKGAVFNTRNSDLDQNVFTIYGRSSPLTRLGAARAGNAFFVARLNGSNLFGIGTETADDLFFATNDIERLRITSGGLIGINGVTAPSTAFDLGAGAIEGEEMTAPGAGAANTYRIYAVDNGGKTELYAIFNTGAAQLIAAQP